MSHHHDVDWAAQAESLISEAHAYNDFFAAAFDDLRTRWVAENARTPAVMDIGCGPGVTSSLLAQSFSAPVHAVDGAPELLRHAREIANRSGVEVATVHATLPDEIDQLPHADIIWAANSLHHIGDQTEVVAALSSRLHAGGLLAVAEGGLNARWLGANIGIGRPGLVDRMDAARASWFAGMRAETPDYVAAIDDWPTMLRSAGLVDVTSRSYLVDVPAPAPAVYRTMLRSRLERYRDQLAAPDTDDRATIDQLLDPTHPLSVEKRPDLFFLTARTVTVGRKP